MEPLSRNADTDTGTGTPGNNILVASCRTRTRAFALTLWEYSQVEKILDAVPQYFIWGEEICPTTGKLHYQSYVYWKNPRTKSGMMKLLGDNNRITPANGTPSQNFKYCSKDGKFQEFGRIPSDNGVRNIEEIVESCNSLSQIMDENPSLYCRNRNGLADLMVLKNSKHKYYKPIQFIWLYGKTGKNKTRTCFEAGAEPIDYHNSYFTDWRDARIIVIEEFRGQIPYNILLKLSDCYHNYYSVNIKGGQKYIDIDRLYVTSPYPPESIYKDLNVVDNIKQLLRRITEVICVDEISPARVSATTGDQAAVHGSSLLTPLCVEPISLAQPSGN